MVNSVTNGDLARSYLLRQQMATQNERLDTLARELSTARVSDVTLALSGDFAQLSGIEHGLKSLQAYTLANAETELFAAGMQHALGVMQSLAVEVAPSLLSASESGSLVYTDPAASDARSKFSTVLSALNGAVGGRHLFAGTATDTAPMATAEDMLAELTLAVAGETTAAGFVAAVDAWFDTPGGGFETLGYQGANTALGPMTVGRDETVKLNLTGDRSELRDLMKGFAVASLIAEGAFAGSIAETSALLSASGEQILSSQAGLSSLRAEVGIAEGVVENAGLRNASETAALSLARTELIGVDQYETATALEDARGQIEMIYAVTARLSRLSLVEYI